MKAFSPAIAAYKAPRILMWMVGLRPSHAWVFVLLCLDLAVLGDLITGKTLWFGPGYLLVMCLAAWCLGCRAGFAIGFGCTALTFAVNGVALYPSGTVDLVWNFIARFVAIGIVIVVVAGSRRAYLREWWLARRDPLTGAFNRQAFFELSEGLARSGNWRVLFFADLDGLKHINDEHGHAAGDRALQRYADVVRRNIRSGDLFARVGGDEFLVFMSIKDSASGKSIAQRLHKQMNSISQDRGGFLRCSLGALIIAPGERQIDQLVRQADTAMYRAKLDGAALEIMEESSAHALGIAQSRSRSRALGRQIQSGDVPPRGSPFPRVAALVTGKMIGNAAPEFRRRSDDPCC